MSGKGMKSACAASTLTILALICCRPAEGQVPLKTDPDRQEQVTSLEKKIPALMEAAFPESANVWDSLAEAMMKNGDDAQAILLYKKAIETASRDQKTDKAFLDRMVAGAREKVDRLEKRMSRRLPDEEAEKKYARVPNSNAVEVLRILRLSLADPPTWCVRLRIADLAD